jgi:hypothetical protein
MSFPVLEEHRDDLREVVLQLVDRLSLGVCAGPTRHVADVQPSLGVPFDHGVPCAHLGTSPRDHSTTQLARHLPVCPPHLSAQQRAVRRFAPTEDSQK